VVAQKAYLTQSFLWPALFFDCIESLIAIEIEITNNIAVVIAAILKSEGTRRLPIHYGAQYISVQIKP